MIRINLVHQPFCNKVRVATFSAGLILLALLSSCSSKKNTNTTRAYHAINTKYNIYFNAEQAYNEALKTKNESNADNLSQIISVYPYNPDLDENKKEGGAFNITIDKCTKAIKLHSIQTKPERDPDKKKDLKYQEWLKEKEFNPYLKNAWLLMGKAEYQNEDYLKASSTFSYITHLYQNDKEVVTEARLWIALAYTQMGWMYEADNIFEKMKTAGDVPANLTGDFASIYGNYLVRNKEYKAAVPYIESAIKSEKNNYEKTRLKYLLGQLYAKSGEPEKAYKAFESVQGMRTPYIFTLNAKIRQSELYNPKNKKKVISSLSKMGKSSKNKEYLDQIYYALGNIYMNDKDTIKAINNYKTAIEKSTRNGFDKAICQLRLGEIYFQQRDYIKAQPCYAGVISVLSKKDERYPLAALRSEVLDELVVHAQAIHLQDSIQHLASLPEEERNKAIDKYIVNLKKEEEQRKREETLAKNNAGEESVKPSSPINGALSAQSSFYFYNPQTVEKGKLAFQRQWGNRKLEDNWRLQNKKTSVFDDVAAQETDSIAPTLGENGDSTVVEKGKKKEDDIYSREFYIEQLPFTKEAVEASNAIIENALFSMGNIYKDKLGDPRLAIDAFETDVTRFPKTPNLEEIYYQLFLIYLQLKDRDMAENYRKKLMSEFAGNKYAVMLADNNYEWNMTNMTSIQDSLYDQTYSAYLGSNIKTVRRNYEYIKEKYPLSKLMPKFMLLNALTYAQTNDVDTFRISLQELVDKYPDSGDVNTFASGMLKNLSSGKTLAADNSPTKGMIWDLKFADEKSTGDAALAQFTNTLNTDYTLLLIYDPQTVDQNQLIYDVASYNFSEYKRKTFDLVFSEAGKVKMLQVKGFSSHKEISDYLNKAFLPNSLVSQIDSDVIPVPISVENLAALMKGKSLNDYFSFYTENHSSDMQPLISYWKKQIQDQVTKTASEATESKIVGEVVQKPQEPEKPITEVAVPKEEKTDTGSSVEAEKPKVEPEKEKVEASAADLFSDEQVEQIDNVVNTAKEIIDNPVDGLKNLFNKNKPKLTKEEKEQQKQEKAEAKRIEKEHKQAEKLQKDSLMRVEKAQKDSVLNAEKAVQDAIKQAEVQKQEELKQLAKEKEEKIKTAAKAKEEARKQKEEQQKTKEKERQEKLKQKEKERKEKLKQKENERKSKQKR
ncbi:MAG: tetratricopeptide repeat protein [Dysgonomonas sp.]